MFLFGDKPQRQIGTKQRSHSLVCFGNRLFRSDAKFIQLNSITMHQRRN